MASGLTSCCSCNGKNAKCARRRCVKAETPHVSCLLMKSGACQNLLLERQICAGHVVMTCGSGRECVDLNAVKNVEDSFHESTVSENENVDAGVVTIDSGSGAREHAIRHYLESQVRPDIVDPDNLIMKAYREKFGRDEARDDVWFGYWNILSHLKGKQYSLPGGAVGRKYVDLLSDEIGQVGAGNYTFDCLIVFSALILQRDKMIIKSADVCRVLERRMKLWSENHFDLLV